MVSIRWVPVRPAPPPPIPLLPSQQLFVPPKQTPRIPVLPRNFEEDLKVGLQLYPPAPTKSGVNGSFFLSNSKGQRAAIFKPINMEAGMPKNHRLDKAHNVQFRRSILPGQGAGNEVLAYVLDKQAFRHRYGIPNTFLMRLKHAAFEGEELGSVQAFIPGSHTLADMTSQERAKIPKREWEKLNFRLISGSTDAHYGNILFCPQTQKLFLIDSGDDFVGASGECEYYNPWVAEPMANQPMSQEECTVLANLDIREIMRIFEDCALTNEEYNPVLRLQEDKYLTQILRLQLAKTAGRLGLTQAEWFSIMCPKRDLHGQRHRSILEKIYNVYIGPHTNKYPSWKEVIPWVPWSALVADLERAAQELLRHRVKAQAFIR